MTHFNQFLKMLALAGMYFFASWLIIQVGHPVGLSLPIFPAAGVALGASICCGNRLWPGVFLGALVFNIWFMNIMGTFSDPLDGKGILIAAGMSVAATAQALFGAFLFRRYVSSQNPLNRTKDVLSFIFIVALVGCMVSGSISLTILGWAGQLPWSKFINEMVTWWLGDFMGVLLVSPLFFVFRQPLTFKWTPARRVEVSVLLLLFYVTSQVVFGDWLEYSHYPLVYMLFPCLVWAAYRFNHPGTVISILLVSAIAVLGTMEGRGPFTSRSLEESFTLLQSYLLVLTVMTLILSAAATEAEEAHTQSVRFGRVLDESSNEIYLFDARTLKFIQVNRGARENLGYSLEELYHLTPVDLKPDFSRRDFEAILKPLRRGHENLVIFQARHQRKNGTLYSVEARIQLSHAEVWPVFVAIVQDITEKQRIDKELEGYRHHLEELVLQRTVDLETAHRQLMHAEKLSATGKMAASMAHEFNNPIYGIRNVLEKILRRIQMDENNTRFVKLAIKECDRVTSLIRKILDFHSPSPDEKRWMDIHESIEDMLLLISKKFSERGIRLIREYAEDMPKIEAVPDQFKQVVLNLLQNAEEAIPDRGGSVVIATNISDGKARIQIKDTGSGIPEGIIKNIFDPFFTTKPAVKGTGLGLSVTYGIIKKHGGDITVDSLPGRGTTFTIILPVKHETSISVAN
ncbi:MAG: MASE1 domain-containing protein [Nitrospinota bacterium]|nr:MASE1 domain-containing protein [Nitrospinota bacterium]